MSDGIKIREVTVMKNTGFTNVYHSAENTEFLFPFYNFLDTNYFVLPVKQ